MVRVIFDSNYNSHVWWRTYAPDPGVFFFVVTFYWNVLLQVSSVYVPKFILLFIYANDVGQGQLDIYFKATWVAKLMAT